MGAGIECNAIDEVRVSFVLEIFTAVRKLALASLLEKEFSIRGESVRGIVRLCRSCLINAMSEKCWQ